MSSTATVFIDEIEVTNVALEGSSTRRLNRPSEAQVKLPMQHAIGGPGSLLKVYFDGVLHHHGRVLLCETSADENTGYTVYNSVDPLEMWKWRPVRDSTGNFALPGTTDNIQADLTNLDGAFGTAAGPQMVGAILANSQNPGATPDDAEGPLFLTEGTIATGGVDLSGAPTDWPMTMAQLATLLVSTGEVDIIITPTELTDSTYTCDGDIVYNYGQIDVANGSYGTNHTADVVFQYGFGALNVRALRWNQDMSNMCNKLWYYLGPKLDNQHWKANITGDDPAFNPDAVDTGPWIIGNLYAKNDRVTNGGDTYVCIRAHSSLAITEPGVGANWQTVWSFWMVPSGGRMSPPASAPNNPIGVQDFTSRCDFGVRMDIKIFDGQGFESSIGRDLYRRLWQVEQFLRAQPQTLVHITPTRDTEIGTFDIGDRVTVEASAEVNGGFSGFQRVYEYTISWDQDSVCALSELQTSPDNAGID